MEYWLFGITVVLLAIWFTLAGIHRSLRKLSGEDSAFSAADKAIWDAEDRARKKT